MSDVGEVSVPVGTADPSVELIANEINALLGELGFTLDYKSSVMQTWFWL